MKLIVDLSALLAQPKKMGETVVVEIEEIHLPPLSREGEKLKSLDDLSVVDGLLAHGDAQIVLYIQDHSYAFEAACRHASEANRFHIAECATIRKMRASGRFGRYVMSNNPSGKFYATNSLGEGEYIELYVCMNCLNKINYKNYRQLASAGRYQIVYDFDPEEFFEKYSSFFDSFPSRHSGSKDGYTSDWAEISRKIRKAAGYRCQNCNVDLSKNQHLLHTHHINGVKHDNKTSNLQALCIDCHSKAPKHDRMHVPRSQRLLVSHLRAEQEQVNTRLNWTTVFQFADPAVEGLLQQCHAFGVPCPDACGFPLRDEKGQVVANLELAWLFRKVGVAVMESDKKAAKSFGWRVGGVNQTIEYVERLYKALI